MSGSIVPTWTQQQGINPANTGGSPTYQGSLTPAQQQALAQQYAGFNNFQVQGGPGNYSLYANGTYQGNPDSNVLISQSGQAQYGTQQNHDLSDYLMALTPVAGAVGGIAAGAGAAADAGGAAAGDVGAGGVGGGLTAGAGLDAPVGTAVGGSALGGASIVPSTADAAGSGVVTGSGGEALGAGGGTAGFGSGGLFSGLSNSQIMQGVKGLEGIVSGATGAAGTTPGSAYNSGLMNSNLGQAPIVGGGTRSPNVSFTSQPPSQGQQLGAALGGSSPIASQGIGSGLSSLSNNLTNMTTANAAARAAGNPLPFPGLGTL